MPPSNPRHRSPPSITIDNKHLPANFRIDGNTLLSPNDDLSTFLSQDLSVEPIDEVFDHLWLVGRPYPPRSISTQTVLGRQRVPCPDITLHLVWASGRIYIKPLPRYILEDTFYDQCLTPSATKDPGPGQDALGLLFSYCTLVPSEVDFELAQKDHLIPSDYKWEKWQVLVSRVLHDYKNDSIYKSIPRRYVYGELRHERLDKIYRYLHGHWLHGYSHLMGASTYGDFINHNLGPITAATVYIILVLTAMQVMLAAEAVADELGSASYGFSIFSIVAPLAAVGIIAVALAVMIIANWVKTVHTKRRRFEHLDIGLVKKQKRRGRRQAMNIDLSTFEPMHGA